MRELFEKDFSEPFRKYLEADHKKAKDLCIDCGMPIGPKEKNSIAFMNEVAILLDKMNIPIRDVLKAASTKWNFLNFKPGLVGGHCIGVDPYYLIHKAKECNFSPQMIEISRNINENMALYIANKTLDILRQQGKNTKKCIFMQKIS